ncbi:hypothetical protein ACFL9U_18000 [Thermodesulfobacteriota bacterium]
MKNLSDILGVNKGARIILLTGTEGHLEFEISLRRHKEWGTYTFYGFADFTETDDADQLISGINNLSQNQPYFLRGIHEELRKEGINSSINHDGFLEMDNGRWLGVGGGMASCYTNEYMFDLYDDDSVQADITELVHKEVAFSEKVMRPVCRAFHKLGDPIPEPAQSIKQIDVISEPLILRFIDHAATKEIRETTITGRMLVQSADAFLLRNDTKVL